LGYIGVVLGNGEKVSDLEAIRRFKKHPTELTSFGLPKIEDSSLPPFNVKEGEMVDGKMTGGGVMPSAMISLLIGAIKEQDNEIQDLRSRVEALEARA